MVVPSNSACPGLGEAACVRLPAMGETACEHTAVVATGLAMPPGAPGAVLLYTKAGTDKALFCIKAGCCRNLDDVGGCGTATEEYTFCKNITVVHIIFIMLY